MMESCLHFSTSTELVRIPSDAVVYISASGNYSVIKTADGGEYTLTIQLGQIEDRIPTMVENGDDRFIRIGKSLIVNRDYITCINPGSKKMILSDSHTFRYSVSASKDALRALKEHLDNRIGNG